MRTLDRLEGIMEGDRLGEGLASFLLRAARMIGASTSELLGAAALNLWGAPKTHVYLGPASLEPGDWIYLPQTDALGIVDGYDGFGRFADYADCLAGFIDALGLESPHVVGNSFGGSLALQLYARSPAMPRSLVPG